MSAIIVKSPTRIDLAGGTLDCWPLNAIVGLCYTINLSISIFTHVHLQPLSGSEIELDIKDLSYRKKFPHLQSLLECDDPELVLIKSHLNYWQPSEGFYLKTSSESPVGGGLGGSSSLTVSLIQAFSKWLERPVKGVDLVTLASNLEARFLGTPTGTQDYIGAYSQGLNLITYDYDGIKFEALPYDKDYFKDRISVIYTGKSHHSGINNWQVIKEVVEKKQETMKELKEIARLSHDFKQICVDKKWDDIPALLNKENDVRVRLSSGFMNKEIGDLKSIAFTNGATGFKICGAGGGGCVMVWSNPEDKTRIEQACQEKNYKVLTADPYTPQD